MDLRVEDHAEPIKELRRLVRLRRAYNLEDAGDNAIAAKQPEEALTMYEQAASMAPDVVELQFWAAVSMYTNQREKDAPTEVLTGSELVPGLAQALAATFEE